MRFVLILVIFLNLCLGMDINGQPQKAFFVVHCDPNEAYNFPNLEILVDSANVYNVKLTVEFTSFWIDSIIDFPYRMNKIKIWQDQGHEIGLHHHGLSAFGLWDGYSNYSMEEIQESGRDTNQFIGTMDNLYDYIQLVSDLPLQTIGVEDSIEMPGQVFFQTAGYDILHGHSDPFQYQHQMVNYCKVTHCFLDSELKEELLENSYNTLQDFEFLGANTHVHNFVSTPDAILNYFRFLDDLDIPCRTVSELLNESCLTTSVQKHYPIELSVFPNPSYGMLCARTNYWLEDVIFELYDIKGKQVYSVTDLEGDYFELLDLDLKPGVYSCLIRKVSGSILFQGKVLINSK